MELVSCQAWQIPLTEIWNLIFYKNKAKKPQHFDLFLQDSCLLISLNILHNLSDCHNVMCVYKLNKKEFSHTRDEPESSEYSGPWEKTTFNCPHAMQSQESVNDNTQVTSNILWRLTAVSIYYPWDVSRNRIMHYQLGGNLAALSG